MTVVSPCTQDLMDSTHPHAVLSKLNEQRSQGLFCDVTIVVEDVKFRAHRNILAACSGYFRNALMASEAWSSGQVLELMDLKSEVFASILNFIYCSKVASTGTDDTRGLVAAGKKLGIPFLERLSEQERQSSAISKTMHQGHMTTDSNHGPVPKKTKKEPPRPEDIDLTSGPRITNAFSITEAGPGNNPFTPLVLTNGERQSPDVGQVPASRPTISCPTVINETAHALSEHSYAVSQAGEQNDGSPRDLKKFSKPPLNQNVGPLKKRHRLRGTLSRSIVPAEVPSPPPPLHVEAETEKSTTESAVEQFQIELDPPTLSPHVEDSIYIYGCEYCAEIFTNRALLTVHMDIHKRRFVSHLFCKFCDKKFMHLKRLRNHEHVCPKAISSHPETDSGEKHSVVDDIQSNPPNVDSTVAQLTTAGVPIAYIPEPLQTNQSAATRSEKPRASQRVYSCSVCKRVYVTLSSLKRHENVHSWQRAYPCHYCNKVFALAEYRTKHEIWHTGERRYQCIFCLETFMTYYILKNHQKSFHGIDPRLAMKKKSANGGLKASVYPIKLYRLLPMKFRKRRYKTYSETYSEKVEGIEEQATLSSSSLIPAFEENNIIRNPDAGSFPMPVTFMATTKMVAPVMPHISFDQPFDPDIDEGLSSDVEKCNKRGMRNTERRSSPFTNHENSNALQKDSPIIGDEDNAHTIMNLDHISHTIPLLAKTLNTVNKLGELSAAAKRVEAMTKEILLSGTNNQTRDVMVAGKTETYIAKPACPGPSVDGGALPLCQITVKIGNEAIIRRRIKGSKLFPRKKKKSRHHMDSPGHWFSTEESSESSGIHSRAEISATKQLEMYDDPKDHETDDKLWRPYYSYKAKKKRKKWRIKHGRDKQYVFPSTSVARSATIEDYPERRCMVTNESNSSSSGDTKRNVKNCSPRANYKCDICDSYFITESGLRAHIIGSHPCFCRTCGKQGPPGEAPAGGEYVCKSCMENGSCFDNTPRSPSTEKKYRCSFCPQRFVYVATKRSHEKKHQETTGKGNKIDKYPSKHSAHLDKDSEQGIKSEDEEEEISNMKCSEVGRGHLSMDKVMPKIEDINQEINQGTNSHAKGPLSPSNTDTFLPLSPTKVKHKMSKKRMVMAHHIHLASKKPEPDKDNNKCPLTRPRTDSVDIYEKGPHLFWKNDSETIGPHISMPKSEK